MINDLLFSVNAVLPVFLMVFFGYFLKKVGIVTKPVCDALNKLSFGYTLPCLLMRDVMESDFRALFNVKLILSAVCLILCFFTLSWIIAGIFIKDKKKLGSFVQICFRSNYVIMGVALLTNMYGNAGSSAMLIAVVVPVFNMLAVILLTTCGTSGKKLNIGSLLLSIVKNPMIIGAAVGLTLNLLEWKFPAPIMKTVNYISNMASPVGFIAIGSAIELSDIFDRYSIWSSLTRLVIVPITGTAISIFLGFRGQELMALVILFAAPTAVSSYTMADRMGCDGRIAANGVFVATLFSVVTVTGFIYAVKAMGLG